jgi:hypothetical protein
VQHVVAHAAADLVVAGVAGAAAAEHTAVDQVGARAEERTPADAPRLAAPPKPARTTPKRHGKCAKEPKTELLKVRLTPEERAELEAMAGTSTLSRFVRRQLRAERTRAI